MAVVTAAYLLFGYAWFFELAFGGLLDPTSLGYWKHAWNWAWASVLFAGVPALACRRWGLSRRDVGIHPGRFKWGLLLVIVGTLVPAAIPASVASDSALAAEYPLARPLLEPPFRWWALVLWEVGYVFLYYVPYETFWRGFAQIPLVRRCGASAWVVVVATTALTTLLHWNKPTSEILGALAVGPVYGYLSIKLDSIYYGLANHVEVGVTTDVASTLLALGVI